jgi:hypothetical protein
MDILLYTLKAVAYALTQPYLVVILIIMAFVLYRQNKKTTVMQKMIIGDEVDSAFELTISQLVIGIFAGCAASILLSYLGIVFDENSAVDLIFLISIILMFWSPRLICFSYSGALLGATSLILKGLSIALKKPGLDFLQIDIPALMTLVAVLHFIEGILVIGDGKRGAIPVFTNRENKIVGGFAMQRYWALPIALLLIVHDQTMLDMGSQVAIPNWWPILKGGISPQVLKDALITLFPFYGMVGYSSITFTKNKQEKSTTSGLCIMLFSVLLFIVARLSTLNLMFEVLVLIFAPLAHEAMFNVQKYIEIKGKPKYISDDNGIMVLEVAPASPANKMGIKSGDLLIEVNDKIIESEEDILNALREASSFIWFKIKRAAGNIEEVSFNRMNPETKLGVVMVPRGIPKDSMVVKINENRFQEILDKIKNRDKDKDE